MKELSPRQRQSFFAVVFLYIVLHLAFYPRVAGIMDENAYLSEAFAFRQGTPYLDVAGLIRSSYIFAYPVKGHIVTIHSPGLPALLALFSLPGWGFVYSLNFVVHLVNFALLVRLMSRQRISVWYALLYLMNPVAVIFSRTVMSDLVCGMFVLAAFSCYLDRRWFWAGMLIGGAFLVRAPAGLAVALLGIGVVLERDSLQKTARVLLGLAVGFAPLAAVAYYYQKVIQEGGWAKYGGGTLQIDHLPSQGGFYATALMIVFPLQLLAPFFYRAAGKATLLCLCYGFVGMYSLFYYYDRTSSFAETLIVGQRFLLIVLPLFMLAYGHFLNGVLTKLRLQGRAPLLLAIASLLLLGITGAIHKKHQNHLKTLIAEREEILRRTHPDDVLICDADIGKLFLPIWGMRDFKTFTNMFLDDDRRLMREAWNTRTTRLIYVSKSDTRSDGSPVAPVEVFELKPAEGEPTSSGLRFREVTGLKTSP